MTLFGYIASALHLQTPEENPADDPEPDRDFGALRESDLQELLDHTIYRRTDASAGRHGRSEHIRQGRS